MYAISTRGGSEMLTIQSPKNERVKKWKKLLKRKGREELQQYLIEGFHLIEEALRAELPLAELIIREDIAEDKRPVFPDSKIIVVSKEVAKVISETENSQGVYAVMDKPHLNAGKTIERPFLMVDAVQDPGNLGTMIRSADAAGFQGVILGNGTVDAYNPKTIRAAQGSHFHITLIDDEIEEWISRFQNKGFKVYGTALDDKAESYSVIHHTDPFALIVGNEGSGVRNNILSLTDSNLYIPIKGKAESLNVTIAASILMFSLYK